MKQTYEISSLSKEYEKYYKEINDVLNDSNKTIKILSDLFLLSVIETKNKHFKDELDSSYARVKSEYKNLFFTDLTAFNKQFKLLEIIFLDIKIQIENVANLSGFESVLGMTLEKHINRKATGSYYTPLDTTKFICWNSIFISILNKAPETFIRKMYANINITNNVEFIDKKLTFEEKIKVVKNCITQNEITMLCDIIKNIKIIDPTCGSGAFIISAYECLSYLNQHLLDNQLDKNYFYKNLYGVDIQEETVILCKTRLIIKAFIDDNFSSSLLDTIQNNITVANALNGNDNVIKNAKGFDWRTLGNFDCIVGNPPYVEVKDKDTYSHFESVKCRNLYAYTIERACNISNQGAIVSFVIPLPFIATSRMSTIKEYLESKSSIVYYCTFADRPGCLFTGVHQRLAIFFANIGNGPCNKYSSSYNFWYKDERKDLFTNLDFIENNHKLFPKIGTNIENSIFVKSRICTDSVYSLINKEGQFPLYVSSRIGFWAKAFLEKPNTNEITVLNFDNDEKRRVVYCFINSSLFYFLWIILSDCWHVTNLDFQRIMFNYSSLTPRQIAKLVTISNELSEDLEKNKVKINTKQTEYEYKHKYSKKIIDKIDDIICVNCGLNQAETKYIKTYTLKYRLNKIEESEE